MTRRLILAAALAFGLAGAAAAGPVTLRNDITPNGGVLTLGDLFEGAGSAADVPVAAVRPGQSLVMDAGRVQQVAAQSGLQWANIQGLRRVIVRGDAVRAGNREVLSYARDINPGDIVQPSDLVWGKAVGAPADAPRDAETLIGKAARRPLRQGTAATLHDVSSPMLIKKDDVVSVTFEEDGVRLVLQAKAMASAAEGEGLALMNTNSKKLIQATASGPDEAVVGPPADRLRAAGAQFASIR